VFAQSLVTPFNNYLNFLQVKWVHAANFIRSAVYIKFEWKDNYFNFPLGNCWIQTIYRHNIIKFHFLITFACWFNKLLWFLCLGKAHEAWWTIKGACTTNNILNRSTTRTSLCKIGHSRNGLLGPNFTFLFSISYTCQDMSMGKWLCCQNGIANFGLPGDTERDIIRFLTKIIWK